MTDRSLDPSPAGGKVRRSGSAVGSTSHGSAHSSTARGPGLSLAVDGAKNPERVPTNLAYRHFIYVSALRVGASEREIVRRDSFLARVGLSEADRSAYVAAVQNVAEQLADVEARLEANGDATQVDSLRQQQRQLLDTAAANARGTVSAEGAQRLEAFIQAHVKSHIKIFGDARVLD